ncbi:hypothetical protein JCM10207_002251 [Rhodosporidiobolus poonsookiae]
MAAQRPPSLLAFSNGIALVALLIPLANAAVLPASPSTILAATIETTSDGSGTPPYLHSASFLLFAIESLVIGLFLLTCGHRGWRATTALGTGLLVEFLVWLVIANTLPGAGFSSESASKTGIIVWALVTAGGVVGLTVGAFFWRVGIFASGACAGLALGLGIDMMGDNALPAAARWVILGVLSGVGLVFSRSSSNLSGCIDLFVNEVDGMSQGLRYILDHNSAHTSELNEYSPPVSTRVLLAVSWAAMLFGMAFQWWFWMQRRRHPFIRKVFQLKMVGSPVSPTPEQDFPDYASDYRLPTLPPGLSDNLSLHCSHSDRDRDMQERYQRQLGSPSPDPVNFDSRGASPLLPRDTLRKIEAIRHPRDLSSPDDPPSRPASVVSTEFADVVPVVAVPPPTHLRPSPPRRPSIPSSVPVGPDSEDGSTFLGGGNRQTQTSSDGLTVGGAATRAFSGGLATGELASLPATSNPSSGNDISTLLGGRMDTPPLFSTPHPPALQPGGVAGGAPIPSEGRPSTEDTRSFTTADFPSTPTEVRALSPLEAQMGGRYGARGVAEDSEELR